MHTLNENNTPINFFNTDENGIPIVPIEDKTIEQIKRTSELPFVKRIAVMPDAHLGKGASIGSVIATDHAIIPAAVGVDLGCGMMAVKSTYTANDLPDNLSAMRSEIETAIPHGRTNRGGRNDKGAWQGKLSERVVNVWNSELRDDFETIKSKHPKLIRKNTNILNHLGTLGTGNHFVEVCLDQDDSVWYMLHSGSRGVGARIGNYFIQLAKREMKRWYVNVPEKDLAYLPEGSQYFDDYCDAVSWAQKYARLNREIMMDNLIAAVQRSFDADDFQWNIAEMAVNCHHNYVTREKYGKNQYWITRKGAVRAREGDLGIIPGSMGAKSFIVRGKGNRAALHSCAHGAGRLMSRTEARKRFSANDLRVQTEGVECRKDLGVVDEIPAAYNPHISQI